MKIFVLNVNARQNAESYCDEHIDDAIVFLSKALSLLQYKYSADESELKGLPKINILIPHKWLNWIDSGYKAYFWSTELFYWLCKEYEFRFGNPHPYEALFYKLREIPKPIENNYDEVDFPKDLPTRYSKSGTVSAYRHYYHQHYAGLTYSNRKKPHWAKVSVK